MIAPGRRRLRATSGICTEVATRVCSALPQAGGPLPYGVLLVTAKSEKLGPCASLCWSGVWPGLV